MTQQPPVAPASLSDTGTPDRSLGGSVPSSQIPAEAQSLPGARGWAGLCTGSLRTLESTLCPGPGWGTSRTTSHAPRALTHGGARGPAGKGPRQSWPSARAADSLGSLRASHVGLTHGPSQPSVTPSPLPRGPCAVRPVLHLSKRTARLNPKLGAASRQQPVLQTETPQNPPTH